MYLRRALTPSKLALFRGCFMYCEMVFLPKKSKLKFFTSRLRLGLSSCPFPLLLFLGTIYSWFEWITGAATGGSLRVPKQCQKSKNTVKYSTDRQKKWFYVVLWHLTTMYDLPMINIQISASNLCSLINQPWIQRGNLLISWRGVPMGSSSS